MVSPHFDSAQCDKMVSTHFDSAQCDRMVSPHFDRPAARFAQCDSISTAPAVTVLIELFIEKKILFIVWGWGWWSCLYD